MHSCVHVCTLACGLPDGRPGENMRMPDIKLYNPHITMYIESGARNGSAAFYWSSSGCWMGVPIRNIRHTASWRCEIAGSGGAARMAEFLIAATTRAPARHRRDIVPNPSMLTRRTTHLLDAHPQCSRSQTSLYSRRCTCRKPWREKCVRMTFKSSLRLRGGEGGAGAEGGEEGEEGEGGEGEG